MSRSIGLIWPQTSGLWSAGNLYFENLLRSIALAGRAEDVVILGSEEGSPAEVEGVGSAIAHSTVPVPWSSTGGRARLINSYRRRLGLKDPDVRSAVSASGVDVVFGDIGVGENSSLPWVGWIPDFQHAHFPELFQAQELADRDCGYRRIAQRATRVLLSSEAAARDYAEFAPAYAKKARVASFVSLIPDALFEIDPSVVVRRYVIQSPFVVVPNQWWRHKNHEVALRAAALLRDEGTEVRWVMTGALADYRGDRHISTLLQLISELDLRSDVVILGALPRAEQVQLMRAADCIVQPSLFEGWSTVVEDAKSLGQRIVLSDIAVHREQAPPASLFFDPGSEEDLAMQVARMLSDEIERPSEPTARAAAFERGRAFGERFVAICEDATGGSGNG